MSLRDRPAGASAQAPTLRPFPPPHPATARPIARPGASQLPKIVDNRCSPPYHRQQWRAAVRHRGIALPAADLLVWRTPAAERPLGRIRRTAQREIRCRQWGAISGTWRHLCDCLAVGGRSRCGRRRQRGLQRRRGNGPNVSGVGQAGGGFYTYRRTTRWAAEQSASHGRPPCGRPY